MAYVIMQKGDLHVTKFNKLYNNTDYYVYDTTDGTIEVGSGRDILLLYKSGRKFLNFTFESIGFMKKVCITHEDLGICLQKGDLVVANAGKAWVVHGVRVIDHIIIGDGFLTIRVQDMSYIYKDCVFTRLACRLVDCDGLADLSYEYLGDYKLGYAGAEITRRCI